jgi:hypothetical protein
MNVPGSEEDIPDFGRLLFDTIGGCDGGGGGGGARDLDECGR